MTETNENSKRRLMSSVMAAALTLSSRFSLGRLSPEKRSKKTKLQQLIVVASLYAFVIPVVYGTAQMLNEASVQSSPAASVQPDTIQAALTAQVRGYELVLQREPDNLTALEGGNDKASGERLRRGDRDSARIGETVSAAIGLRGNAGGSKTKSRTAVD